MVYRTTDCLHIPSVEAKSVQSSCLESPHTLLGLVHQPDNASRSKSADHLHQCTEWNLGSPESSIHLCFPPTAIQSRLSPSWRLRKFNRLLSCVRTTLMTNRYPHVRTMVPQSIPSAILYDIQTRMGKASRTWSTSNCKQMLHRELLSMTAARTVTDVTRFHTLTYQLITQQPDYAPFSNVGYSDSRGGRYNSIENMHNGIHMFVGNGGHMSNIPVRDNQMPPVANGREIDTRVDHVLS